MAMLSCLCLGAAAQSIAEMEFRDKPVRDILLVLAESSGASIVCDETVTGNASFYFVKTDLRTALQSFLSANGYYWREDRGVIYVSRVDARIDASGLISVNAEDIDPQLLLRVLSRAAGRTIICDPLPKNTVSLHSTGITLSKAAEIVIAPFPDYSVIQDKDYLYVRRSDSTGIGKATPRAVSVLKKAPDGTYSVDFLQARFLDVLDELMRSENKEYALLMRSDIMLDRMRFSGKSFKEMLDLLLEQAGAGTSVDGGIYYIFEVQKKDIAKRLKRTEIVTLSYIGVQDAVSLLSQDLANSAFYRLDKADNAFILSGSDAEIQPVIDFLRLIDRPVSGRTMYRYETKFIKAKDLFPLIPSRFTPSPPVATPNDYAFVISLTDTAKPDFDAFIAQADQKPDTYPIALRYIKSEDLLKALPPSAAKDEVSESGNPALVFYSGSPEKRARFLRDLEMIDRPRQQLRYDILVIQHDTNSGLDLAVKPKFSSGFAAPTTMGTSASPLPDSGVGWAVTAALDQVFNINFDVISKLGLEFAENLDLTLSQSNTQIFADTSLVALSGQETKFQNTTTYRFHDLETNADTGTQTYTGTIREVSSGLILGINGWTSGNGMITMNVNATVSKKDDSSSTDANAPPETSERVVSTQLRAQSGEPVAITGLIQHQKSLQETKIPLLGDIPFIGFLFKNVSRKDIATEMSIYIVPRVVPWPAGPDSAESRMERLYAELGASPEK